MIKLQFSGWFRCRLATDPDLFDDPRGVSSYVRAYADEPDLDRSIRFQAPPLPRPRKPRVGVNVVSVLVDGKQDSEHPLIGATIDLLDNPVFEGRKRPSLTDGQGRIYSFVL